MKSYFTSQFRLAAFLIISLIATNSVAQTYYSQGSGDFNTLSNWNTNPTGGGDNPTSINATTGAFNVQTGHNIAVNDSVNIASLNVAGTLTFGNDATGRKLIVNGAVTVATNGSVGLSATTATHRMYVGGNIINNGTIDFRPAGSGRVVNVFMTATAAISGANEPIFNTLTVSSGTTTAQRSLYVKGNIVIQPLATFNAGTFTHTLSGNFTRLGTFNHNSGTFILNAPLVQIISTTLTSTTTFNNLTVNGGGILSITSHVTFDGSFLVTNNSKVNTNRDNIFKGSWEVQSGSEYKANNATALFSGSAVQNITIAGTVEFYRLYTQSSVKNIIGELVVKNDFYIYSGSTIQDSLATQTHTFSGNVRIEGTVNFTHKVLLNSGGGISVWNSNDNSTISFGAADIEITGSVYIGNNDSNNTTLHVPGKLTLTEGILVIRNGGFVTGSGKDFYQNENTNLYVRGTNNYPTGFATYTHEPTAWVRYDQNIDQIVRGGITYPHLYLYNGLKTTPATKTLDGDITIDGHLYLYTADSTTITFDVLTHDVILTWYLYENYNNRGQIANINATGGTFTFAAEDRDQNIYRRNPDSQYHFYNLTLANNNPSDIRIVRFYGNDPTIIDDANIDIYVQNDFKCVNSSLNNPSLAMHVDFNNIQVDGEMGGVKTGVFELGENVILLLGGQSQFSKSIETFDTTAIHEKSTVRFDSNGDVILPSIIYGNLEFGGSGNFYVTKLGITVLGNISRVNGTPKFRLRTPGKFSPNHQIKGDWNLTNAYIDASRGDANSFPTITFNGNRDQNISQATFINVAFEGSRKKTFLGSQTVLGNLSIGSEAIVDAQTHTISVAGNWAHLGTSQFIHDGSVYFTGAGSQLVTMLPSLGKFNILRVEKSLGTVLTLNTDIAVQRHIYFLENGGNLDLENHTLTFGGDFYIRKGCDFDWTTGAKLIANGATEDQLIRNYNPAITYPTFEFTGGGIKRLYENPFYFEGNIKIDNATLRGEHFDHYIKGNFVNTGGTFQHSRILYFNGLDQEIDAATFNNVYFTGVGTKRLKGNIIVGGSVTIDTSAVLDVSPDGGTTSYDITIDAHWNNNLFNEDSTKTGIFIPRKGSVIFSGNHSNIYTGDSIKADHTGRDGKQFYNLTINNRDNNTWTRLYPSYGAAADIRVANDVRVLNNFTLEQGLFYTYWNKMYVGGSFENQGGNFQMNTHYTTYPELYFEGNSSGSYSLDPGEIHLFRRVEFLGTGEYKMKRDWNIDRSFTYPNLVVSAGKLVLNHNALSVMSTVTGDITIGASGEMIIDSLAELKIPQTRTLTNNGTFRIVGTASGPAVMRCHTSGANRYYFYKQYGGTTHAKYYSIENTDGYGMDFLGGAIDEVNNFTDGQFSGGRLINDASAYITLRNGAISIPNNHTLKNVLFYSGAHKNIIRETNTGAGIITFENASGPVSGVAHEVDPDNKVEWTYPGAKYWTGLAADDNWNSAKNWSDSLVPDENSQVYLDNSKVTGSYIVNIQADALAKYLNITATETTLNLNGAKLNVNNNIQIGAGNTLTQTTPTDTIFVGGSWSNSGTFNPNSSVVVFTPTNGTYSLSPRAGDTFNHLVVRGANGTLTLATDIEVTGHIKCESGVLYGANRTLKVSGNWSAGFDIFDGGTGTVLFSGNDGVAQTIDGGTFNHVTFEGSSEKQARSTLKINGDVRINIGAVFNGGKESIRAGRYWYNYAGASGFKQSGIGTVIFDGTGTKFIGDYYGNPINTKRTVFNNLSFVGAGTKYIADSITIKGNLKNNIGSNVYVGSAGATATAITGTSGGTFSMDGGVMYLLGINSFPQNFGSYNLTNSTVEYRGSTAQTVAAGSQIHYHNLNLRTLTTPDSTATDLMRKTVTDDLYVKNQVYVINQHAGYDKPTQLVMNNHDMYLENSLVIQDSVNVPINQIDWGIGTFYHTGAGLTLNANVKEFNNFIKQGTGAIILSNTIKVHGIMTFEDNTNLNMRDYAIVCDGEDKTFTIGTNSYLYSYIPDTTATTKYAFPTGFTKYSIDSTNLYYVRGDENQSILPGVEYGSVYLYDDASKEVHLHGDFTAKSNFYINYNNIVFKDNGHDLYLGGYNNDIRNYIPTDTSTMYMNGKKRQRIYSGGSDYVNINNLVISEGSHTSLIDNDNYIKGNVTIESTDTLYTAYNVYFEGSTFDNKGKFDHAARTFHFNGLNQTINPGDNSFNEVFFETGGTKTVVDTGFNIRNDLTIQGPAPDTQVAVDFGALTHNIGSSLVTVFNGTWDVSNSNLVFDRNGTQYIPPITAQNVSFAVGGNKYLTDSINVNDFTVTENVYFRSSVDTESPLNFRVNGNWNVEGHFYPYGNTVYFESNNTDNKTIKSSGRSFYNVVFNSIDNQNRQYTLTNDMSLDEELTLNAGAHLKLGGKTLTLGNNDSDIPSVPMGESHIVKSGAVLEVDENAKLLFDLYDLDPSLDVYGTLRVVGNESGNATIGKSAGYTNRGIKLTAHSGSTLGFSYYSISDLNYDGFIIEDGATINPANNFSNGVWNGIYSGTQFTDPDPMSDSIYSKFYYMQIRNDVSSIGNIENVVFNHATVPVVGRHFNVFRPSGCSGTITFAGDIGGPMGIEAFEDDVNSQVIWPNITKLSWTGLVSTDWFTPGNWSPAVIPDETIDVEISKVDNIGGSNPIIYANDAVCKTLTLTNGFLTIEAGVDTVKVKKDVVLGATATLAIEDNAVIDLFGAWDIAINANFIPKKSTIFFNRTSGSSTISPRGQSFNNVEFAGGATYLLNAHNNEIVFDGDFKISSGTVKPNAINYKYSLKGDYEYVSGTFDQTVVGWFDLNGGVQNITNGRFSRLELNGTGTKTFKDSTIISYNSTSPNLYSLIVRSGVTMKLAENSTMNIEGVVFVNNGGTVDDNDQIIHYYGYYWYGYGDYIGNGFLVFKGGTQHLKGLFTNLHFKNGTTYATGDLQVKGSVILECAYYRPLDNSTSNISGSGKFEVSKNCRIIISGADNYPSGFSEYESDVTSTVFYEGTMDQIVRGNSNNIEIVYGNVTFDKGSTKTLEGDITVLRDLSFLNATTLNANDNIINIGRHWYNQKDGIFNCTQGEVVFTGSENQNIYLGGTSVNDFYKIRVNQQTTDTRVLVYQGSLTIKDKLWVRSGGFYVQNGQSVTVGGDLVASNTGTFWTYGQYILNKSVGNASIQANGSIFNQLTINGGADYTLLDDVAANGSTALSAGTLSLNGNSLTIGNGITFNIEGTLFTNPGGTVKLGNLTSLNVLNGGEIHIVGTPEYPATVTRNSGNNRYAFNVESGAKIHANYYKFEYMDLAGINIKDGAEVDVIDNFSNGTFTNPLVKGVCLQLENSQNFTGADSIANISFPVNPTNGTKNISKTVSSLGVIDIHQWSGALAGPSFENDSYNLINWKTGNTITWVGGTGESGNNWNVANNWDLQRVPEPTDNVIIENTGYPCYIRNIADSVFIKSIIINGPLHLVRDADSARRVLTVDGIVEVNNPVHFSDDSTKLRFSGDFAKGASGQFMTTNGGTMEIYGVGNSSVNNSLSSDKLRLVVQKQGNVAFTTNSNQVKYLEVADGANMSLTHANGNFEVLGSFINYGVIQQGNNKFKLGSSGTYSIYPGVSIYNNIDFVAGTYNLSSPVMNVQGIVDIKAGATLNIGENSLKFGHPTLSRTLTISGSLNFSSNGSALFTNGSKVSVVSSGVLSLIGLENNEVVFSNQGGTGRYEVNINIGGKIAANHYKFEYLHANGIVLAPGSSIDSTNNFGNGIFIYGASGGRYLYFQNTIENTEITISNVNFAQGAKFNAKRESTFTGRVKFLDAYGLLAGHYYEDDDLNMTTGKIIWTYTNPTAFWTGLSDSKWDFQDNWEPKSAPNDSSILFIPAGCTNYPLLNSVTVLDTAVARRLTIYPGGSITFADGKDLSVGEDFVNGGTFTIQSGSSTHVFVGGSFANNGTFTHGGASTLELGSVNNMELSLGTATVFNLTLNSGGAGIGEFSTRSNVNVLGDLKILSGKLVVTNPAHAIYIGGDFINNTGFVHGNGTIYMNGNANKVINNANSDWFYNLALSGLGTKTLVTELKLKKDFTIGAKLVAGTNTITIQGDWKGNKIFDRGTSTVQFTGASPQFIVKSETFHNLIINNSAALSAVTLGNVVKISNNISLTKGRVESGNTNTLTILDNATMTGGSSTAYVVGYMTKIGNEDFTFPIGSDNVYAPIGISDIAGSVSTFKSVYIESGYQINQIQNGMNKVSKVEYWQLFRNAGSGEPLVTFHWNDGVRSGIDNIEPIVAAYYMPGQGWKSMGKSASTGTALAGTVTSEYKYNAFGYCTLGWEYANIEWTGNTDTNWINPDNWSEGTPSASTNVIIPTGRTNYPVLNANGVCYDLSINGGSLTIQEGNTLDALGDVVVDSGVNLNIDGQIQIAGDFRNSGTIAPGNNSVMVFNGSTPQKIDNVMARDLVLSGIGVKSAYNAITVAGNMQIASPFNALASTITISGNLNMPSGSFTRGTSSLIFNGSEAQSITSSYQFLFNNVTVNNTSGTAPQINMGANISIYGTFDLTQGIVSSSSSALLTIENTGIVKQVNHNTSFVSGPMRKVGIDGFVFPLGKDSISARLAITDMSGSGYFQAEYFNNGYSTFTPLVSGLERVSTIEYWDLGRTGGVGNATPKVTLYWEDTARSQITDPASLVVAHYSSSSWHNMSGVASWNGAVGGPGSVKSADEFTTFSPITFGSNLDSENPLPVELVRFTASETTRSTVNVDWITASEYNNDRFELEKSINGVDFERIATVNSKGNSSEFSNYTYEDNAPVYGNNYYRLRQIDFDGTEKLSKIAHAFVNGEVELVSDIYPNPASDKCMIYFNQSVNQKVTVFVYNLSGTVVGAREAFLNGMKSLDISDLINGFSSGVYYVNVMTEGNVKVHKLMIK